MENRRAYFISSSYRSNSDTADSTSVTDVRQIQAAVTWPAPPLCTTDATTPAHVNPFDLFTTESGYTIQQRVTANSDNAHQPATVLARATTIEAENDLLLNFLNESLPRSSEWTERVALNNHRQSFVYEDEKAEEDEQMSGHIPALLEGIHDQIYPYASATSVMRTEEATVLQSGTEIFDNIDVLNRAAIRAALEEDICNAVNNVDALNEAAIRAALQEDVDHLLEVQPNTPSSTGLHHDYIHQHNNNSFLNQDGNNQEARVIEITNDINTGFVSFGAPAAQAELIGQQEYYTTATASNPFDTSFSHQPAMHIATGSAHEAGETNAAEATVIDSAPLEKDVEGWYPGEARVLDECIPNDNLDWLERKPAAVDRPGVVDRASFDRTSLGHCRIQSGIGSSQQAEILDIRDETDIHPDDDSIEHDFDAQAEFLGPDLSSGGAVNISHESPFVAQIIGQSPSSIRLESHSDIPHLITSPVTNNHVRSRGSHEESVVTSPLPQLHIRSLLANQSPLGSVAAGSSGTNVNDEDALLLNFVSASFREESPLDYVEAEPFEHHASRANMTISEPGTAAYFTPVFVDQQFVDSAPLEKDDHVSRPAGQAHVLEDFDVNFGSGRPVETTDNDGPVSFHENHIQGSNSFTFSVADQEAIVIGIRDETDIHPLDDSDELTNVVQAELVGTDFSYGTPSPVVPDTLQRASTELHPYTTCVDQSRIQASVLVEDIFSDASYSMPCQHHEGQTEPGDKALSTPTPSGFAKAVPSFNPRNESDHMSTDQSSKSNPMPGIPSPQSIEPTTSEATSQRSDGTSSSSQMHSKFSRSLASGTANVMEALFGDSKPSFLRRSCPSSEQAAGAIKPRTLLPWNVIRSPANGMWVVTMQTNQKAVENNDVSESSRSLRAYRVPSERQAASLALAWTPPKMDPITEKCHICESKFAILRRGCHCRNCGVCVCKDCSLQWTGKMIPETYNFKKENSVNICKSCDWLCNEFRLALLEGNQDRALALFSTGNVNVYTPFANVKGEIFYPVHCAVLGGNLELLKFLIDEKCCPVNSIHVTGSSRGMHQTKSTPIITSSGRSLLKIALENESIHIVRYLVVEKGLSISEVKELSPLVLSRNLTICLSLMPIGGQVQSSASIPSGLSPPTSALNPSASIGIESPTNIDDGLNVQTNWDDAQDYGAVQVSKNRQGNNVQEDKESSCSIADEECIICCDSVIDCVATPCGHQICCLSCSAQISRCPVCSACCSFMRIYK